MSRLKKPLGLTEFILRLTTSLPRTNPRKYRILTAYFTIHHHMMFSIFILSSFVNLLVSENFFGETLQSCHYLVAGTQVYVKHILIQKREYKFLDLFSELRTLWKDLEKNQKPLLEKHLKSSNRTTFTFYIVIFALMVTLNVLTPVVEHKFPLKVWQPEFLKRNFAIGSTVLVIMHMTALNILTCTTALLVSLTKHTAALGASLVKEIEALHPWDHARLNECFEYHRRIVRLVRKINDLMADMWGFEVICSSVQITFPLYGTVKALGNQEELATLSFILVINICVVYLIFASGSRIQNMGEEINIAMYSVPWYDANIQDQNSVLIMQIASGQPLVYRFKWLLVFDRPRFTTVLQATYSYLTMFKFFDDR